MRYFVLVSPGDAPPYIAAETVRETFDDGSFRTTSFAAHLDLTASEVLMRAELTSTEAGRNALAAWEGRDDSGFDRATEGALEQPERRPLRLVPDHPDEPSDA